MSPNAICQSLFWNTLSGHRGINDSIALAAMRAAAAINTGSSPSVVVASLQSQSAAADNNRTH